MRMRGGSRFVLLAAIITESLRQAVRAIFVGSLSSRYPIKLAGAQMAVLETAAFSAFFITLGAALPITTTNRPSALAFAAASRHASVIGERHAFPEQRAWAGGERGLASAIWSRRRVSTHCGW